MIDTNDAKERFRAKMRERGMIPPEQLIADGKIHRCDVEGKRGRRDGSYLLHLDGVPAGGLENFRDGVGWENWCSREPSMMTPVEHAHYMACIREASRKRDEEIKAAHAAARAEADEIWNNSTPAGEHPYLERKKVKSHGLRMSGGDLVIPLRDQTGEIQTLEFIDAEGKKLYLPGGRKAGCWFSMGKPGSVICIAEGYATAASVHEATGYATAVAFDCGNLLAVASAMRTKFPTAKLIICADDDYRTPGNPGVKKASEAAKKVNAIVATPDFGTVRPDGATDFNDLAAANGLDFVKSCIDSAIRSDSGPIEASELFPLVYNEILDRKEGRKKTAIYTGISAFDRFTGGLRRGYLSTFAGLPGSGKTSAALGIVIHNAWHGVPCLMFSIEMDRIDIGIRCLSMESGVVAQSMFDDKVEFDKAIFAKLQGAANALANLPFTLDDRPVTTSQIEEASALWYARAVKAKELDTGLIAIDYLGLIKSDEGTENRNREVAKMVQRVKLVARSLRVPVILLAQLNREAARRGGEPELADLRDSGEIEAASDLVVFPYPAPRDEEGNKIKKPGEEDIDDLWIIRKNKNGGKGAIKVKWNPLTMLYSGIAKEGVNDE